MDIKSIMKEAQNAANIAAAHQLEVLEAKGPAFSVHESGLFDSKVGPAIGYMLDNCGGAFINLPGRSPFITAIKKQIPKIDRGQGEYGGEFWSMSKSVYKGYTIFFHHSLSMHQEMSIHVAAISAAVEIINKYGAEARVHEYID